VVAVADTAGYSAAVAPDACLASRCADLELGRRAAYQEVEAVSVEVKTTASTRTAALADSASSLAWDGHGETCTATDDRVAVSDCIHVAEHAIRSWALWEERQPVETAAQFQAKMARQR
jgi:hypothetical protein